MVPRGSRVVDHKANLKGGKTAATGRIFRAQPITLTHISFQKEKPLNKSLDSRFYRRWADRLSKRNLLAGGRTLAPLAIAMAVSSVAHAQGSMDFSGAQTLMGTFKTFAIYAGAVICFGSLIFAGIRLMSGRFQEAIPGLFGALFGAGVLGWGAGWISSLTGQAL